MRPDTDAWLLLSMLCVLVEEDLADEASLARETTGWARVRDLARAFPPEETAERTGVAAQDVRALARDLAAADRAAVYGRTGSCLGRFGTLVSFLLDVLMLATGNLDRAGGGVFGLPAVALDEVAEMAGLDTYGKVHSRLGGFPDVLGALPASLLAEEMTTPGEGQIRAFFTSAGNPVLSCPDGEALEAALEGLELYVSLDFYVNETNRHADYILPSTTWLERDDLPIAFLGFYTTPFVQYSDAVIAPRGEAREEWEIIDLISREIGVQPYALKALRVLSRLGYRMTPQRLVDVLLRSGRDGDRFGLRRGGLSLKALRRQPHGVVTAPNIPTGVILDRVRHADHKIHLDHPTLNAEVERLRSVNGDDPRFPLRLIGLRELRSHNSWMHNSPILMRGGREQPLRIHPDDAERYGLEDGGTARLSSKSGAVEVPVSVTDEMLTGVVALPHGWGHRGGWKVANAAGGVNINVLASADAGDLEPLAGMAFLNGIPVRVEPIAPASSRERGRRRAGQRLRLGRRARRSRSPSWRSPRAASSWRTCSRERRWCEVSVVTAGPAAGTVCVVVPAAGVVRGGLGRLVGRGGPAAARQAPGRLVVGGRVRAPVVRWRRSRKGRGAVGGRPAARASPPGRSP